MPDLDELAHRLAALEGVIEEAAAEIAPEIETALRNVGKSGKALRAGNAVAAHVDSSGTTVHIKGVFVKASKKRSWSRVVGRAIKKAVAKRLEG